MPLLQTLSGFKTFREVGGIGLLARQPEPAADGRHVDAGFFRRGEPDKVAG